MEQTQWVEKPCGVFVMEDLEFRLKVKRADKFDNVRFLVLAQNYDGPCRLIGSGTTDNIRDSMMRAQQMASRYREIPRPGKPPVMVACSDADDRTRIGGYLKARDYTVLEASSGAAVLRRLERSTLPLQLVVDLGLDAEFNGLALAGLVRKMWPQVGIVLIGDFRFAAEVKQRDTFLVKPFLLSELLSLIKKISVTSSVESSGSKINNDDNALIRRNYESRV